MEIVIYLENKEICKNMNYSHPCGKIVKIFHVNVCSYVQLSHYSALEYYSSVRIFLFENKEFRPPDTHSSRLQNYCKIILVA